MRKLLSLIKFVVICISMMTFVSCGPKCASIKTSNVTNITNWSAVCGGEVKNENGYRVEQRGICWSTNPNPTPNDSYTIDGESVGKFTSSITGLVPEKTYHVRAYAISAAGTSFGKEMVFTTTSGGGWIGNHKYVDLGLPSGLLWATCNVGARSPWEYGDYYSWGETESYNSGGTYKWYNGDKYTKYNTDSRLGIVDNKKLLESEDDVAQSKWGAGWRMPTQDEFYELKSKCTKTWLSWNEKNGYLFVGPNGNSIFLPAAGYYNGSSLYYAGSDGNCWSSSLDASNPDHAYHLDFNSGKVLLLSSYRYYGLSVRPVCQLQK